MSNFIFPFTPALISPEALENILVQRQELAEYIAELIRESVLTPSKHYTLLIGNQGIGKTHFISLLYHRIRNMADLQEGLLIGRLKEEEFGISSFLDLLIRIIKALTEEYKETVLGLRQKIETLYHLPADEARKAAAATLQEAIGNRTLLLLMENLDEIFAGLGEEGQLQLRGFLQENNFCTILATSQSLFNGVKLQTSPFYGFFRIRNLIELTPEEATQLLANIAKLEGKSELENFILSSTGRDRIQAVHHLVGGNPRLYVILSKFLNLQSLNELQEPFMGMLDALTPYCHVKMQLLSPQQRKIVETLSDYRYALSVKQIAQNCFISHQTASGQLKELRNKNYVISQGIGRESFYELQDPVMGFWLNLRRQQTGYIQLLLNFLRLWHLQESDEEKSSPLSINAATRQCRAIFENYNNENNLKNRLTSLKEFFDNEDANTALSQGLVRSISMIMSDNVSDIAIKLWLKIWQELAGLDSDFQIALEILNTAVDYKVAKSDRRILLKLPLEKRKLLEYLIS